MIAARVEKVRIDGREIRIVGYGTRVRDIHCWYDYEEVLAYFSLYFEPVVEDLAFPNTENFTRRLERGRWNTYRHPDMPEEQGNSGDNGNVGAEGGNNGNNEQDYQYEQYQDQYQDQYQEQYRGRGRSGGRRGRGTYRGDRGARGGFYPRGGRQGRF